MNGLRRAGVALNRKALAELAVVNESVFAKLTDIAKANV